MSLRGLAASSAYRGERRRVVWFRASRMRLIEFEGAKYGLRRARAARSETGPGVSWDEEKVGRTSTSSGSWARTPSTVM